MTEPWQPSSLGSRQQVGSWAWGSGPDMSSPELEITWAGPRLGPRGQGESMGVPAFGKKQGQDRIAGAPGPAGTASATFVLETWTLSAELVSVCTTSPLQQKDVVGSLSPDAAPGRASVIHDLMPPLAELCTSPLIPRRSPSPEGPLVLAWGQSAVLHAQEGKPRVAEHVTT